MIVMKFGGSSLESGRAVRRAAEIVSSHLALKPVVVVSAMGATTNRLLDLIDQATHGHSYSVWKRIKDLQEYHLEIAAETIGEAGYESLDHLLRRKFTQLHRLILETCDNGRPFTPALRDEIASFGERVSSELFAAVLESSGVKSIRLDSREVIVTDDNYTNAAPLYWETYAKLRRVIGRLAKEHTVVMGGFIGATESGNTTTLGRGGSDLTASLVGAGISADEIQIWTDVDGMLTCDPRVLDAGYRVNTISYEEARLMAEAGAKVLHPHTVQPAVRQRIPIVIRNSRRPDCEGTRIQAKPPSCSNVLKSIACKSDLTLLEIRPQEPANGLLDSVDQLCRRQNIAPELLVADGEGVYLAMKGVGQLDYVPMELKCCVEARLHKNRATITLVGEGLREMAAIAPRALATINVPEAFAIRDPQSEIALTIVVPQQELRASVQALHKEFFSRIDERIFCPQVPQDSEVSDAEYTATNYALPTTPATGLLAAAYSRFGMRPAR